MDASTAAPWVALPSAMSLPVLGGPPTHSRVKQTQSIPGGNNPAPAGLSLACRSISQENQHTLQERSRQKLSLG